jgi:hypothetical protein
MGGDLQIAPDVLVAEDRLSGKMLIASSSRIVGVMKIQAIARSDSRRPRWAAIAPACGRAPIDEVVAVSVIAARDRRT